MELGQGLLGVRALGLVEIHDAIELVLRNGLFGRELTNIVELVGAELLCPVQLDHRARTCRGTTLRAGFGVSTWTGMGANSAPLIIDPLRNPGGYCGVGGTGVSCPVGLTSSS